MSPRQIDAIDRFMGDPSLPSLCFGTLRNAKFWVAFTVVHLTPKLHWKRFMRCVASVCPSPVAGFDEVKRVIVLGCDILRYSSARLSISSFARFHFQLDALVFRLFLFRTAMFHPRGPLLGGKIRLEFMVHRCERKI